ncbi:nucleoside-diphosphate-sugar epimerase (UDP-glucose 4-epimerase) [Halorubrum coriense DSM 10284]|uniref:Nucleoside-diphosphate-sugar epimerase (UDP-glucose 4-epimerase) n=1 Tax=Halorubrum coriense DSM 10284 TaxID=1227466 RepID=M0EDH8_9EURY|nr:nucleoside-diphosphate-sugar epimerase (UDP-glucose 4-epimerase) [Halorubrum coriense DSM 10284]
MGTVLLTGSSGGVGAWMVDALADAGREVVADDRRTPPTEDRHDDVVRACELAADHELQGIYNVGTAESHAFNEMVALINDELGTNVAPKYTENPLAVYVHDTMADHSKLHEATG